MLDYIYEESLRRAKHKIWIFSDLQQRYPDKARECMEINMRDFEKLGRPADMMWYLGDAVESADVDNLNEMCLMQEKEFVATGLPLCYAAGNHDFDYMRTGGDRNLFYDTVKRHPDWYCVKDLSYPYYKIKLGNYTVYFLSDHTAPDFSWNTSHGQIHGDAEAYPHYELLLRLKDEMAAEEGPVIIASHYSFAGGSREAPALDKYILPLPQNVKLHFYGHAHIGDFINAVPSPYKRITWVDMHDIPQINVSSFEHIRGHKCRSVFLHIYEDDSCGIFFRNHDDGIFTECYFPAKENYPHRERRT